MMYGPICVYMDIGMYMEVDPMDVPWYVEEYFETLVVGGMVFFTLMCGVFDILDKLKILRVLDHGIANKPIMGRYPLPFHFQW